MQTTRNVLRKYAAVIVAAPLAVSTQVHAALPTNVSTALADLSSDAVEVAGIVLAAIVAVFAFKFIRKGL